MHKKAIALLKMQLLNGLLVWSTIHHSTIRYYYLQVKGKVRDCFKECLLVCVQYIQYQKAHCHDAIN